MALLFCDGFDHYSSIADMQRSNRWTGISKGTASTFVTAGRFNGNAVSMADGFLNFNNNYQQVFVGFATYGNSNALSYYTFYNGSYAAGRVITDWTTGIITLQIYVGTGSPSYVTVATSLSGIVSTGIWYYIELTYKIATSGGVFTVRVNNQSVVTYSGNTQQYTLITSSVINNLQLTYASNGALYDDLYLCDASTGSGSRPMNDFLGDKRVYTMFPASNNTAQWTPISNFTITSQFVDGGTTATMAANRTYLSLYTALKSNGNYYIRESAGAIIATQDVTINSITIYVSANVAGIHIRPVIYSESSTILNTPSALYATGNETTGLGAGGNTLTFTSVTLQKGKKYFIGFIADAAFVIKQASASASGIQWAYQASTYPTPISTFVVGSATTVSSGSFFYYDMNVTATNYGNVSETYNDGTLSYNTTTSVGNKDLFTTDQGISNDSTVYAVQVTGAYYKDDANTRTVANLLKSGTTEATGTDLSLSASYLYKSDVWAVDPNTSSDWTVANAKAALIGYKVTS